jgi:hypothetical protein
VPAAAETPVNAQQVVTLGNSRSSNVDIEVFHRTDCRGASDMVSPGEMAHNIGSAGSVRINAGWHGAASPWYIIHRRDHAWCWEAPTAVATSVWLRRGSGGTEPW